jgi:hypothetical protein
MSSTKFCTALLLLLLPLAGLAQELTPRAYWPAPVGTRALVLGLAHTSGDTIPDPSLPIVGVDSSIEKAVVGYLQTVDLWGRTANVLLQVPWATGETQAVSEDGVTLKRDYLGLGDIAATLFVNLLGAPSMSPQDFASLRAEPRPILGASVKVVAPTGRYDEDRLINVGANRWAAKFELGYIQPLNPRWLVEFELGAWVFDDNDDFLGRTREQGSIRSAQAHLVHRFRPGFWGSLNYTYYRGGQSTIDGRRLNDLQRDSKVGATFVYPLRPGHALKVSYSQGSINDSDETFNTWQIAYNLLL